MHFRKLFCSTLDCFSMLSRSVIGLVHSQSQLPLALGEIVVALHMNSELVMDTLHELDAH